MELRSRKRKSQAALRFNSRMPSEMSSKSLHNHCAFPEPRLPGKPNSLAQSLNPKSESAGCLGMNREVQFLSAKDLRARRVFSCPTFADKIKAINGALRSGNFSKRCRGSDSNTNSAENKDIMNTKEDWMVRPEAEAEAEQSTFKNGVDLKDTTVSGNGSTAKSITVANSSAKRKVFKTPSSFSYRRMLPHLLDIVKDESSVSEIELVDIRSPSKFRKLSGPNAKMRAIVETTENGKMKESDEKVSFKLNLKGVEEMGSTINGMTYESEQKDHENDSAEAGALPKGEHVQMTPPNDTLLGRAEAEISTDVTVSNSVVENHFLSATSNGSISSNDASNDSKSSQSAKQKDGTYMKTGLGLNPCSRVKVFRTPGSVSYRRLLPFLMDVAQNHSCDSGIKQCNPQMALKENLNPVPLCISNGESHTEKMRTESDNSQVPNELETIVATADCSSSDIDANPGSSVPLLGTTTDSTNMERSKEDPHNMNDPNLPPQFQTGETLQLHDSARKFDSEISDANSVENDEKTNCPTVPPCSAVNDDTLSEVSISEISELEHVTKEENKRLGKEAYEDNGGLIRVLSCKHSSSHIDGSDIAGFSSDGPSRGILKRNPRGCRGPCNCLNCASFRLHAERAFEFSRNQMQDAEELAWELMKELAEIRQMLEKAACIEDNVAIVQLNQVREACKSAANTEELAKERLSQMNYDLDIHCRITDLQRPRVTFAKHEQEKAIPNMEFLSIQKL